jgi:uncharacterized membrane protein
MNRRPLIAFSAAVLVAMLAASAWAWIQLPADAEIPIHWGIDGQVDGYASKAVGLLVVPVVAVIVTAIFAVIPAIEPRRAHLERSRKPYGVIWASVIGLLGAVQLAVVATALGSGIDVSRVIWAGVGGLFVRLGNYLP